MRVATPMAPHVMEQVPHVDHVLSTQSTGQLDEAHARRSLRAEQGLPPCWAGDVTRRVRVCSPPPQEAVHVDQGANTPTTQSMGHGIQPGHTRAAAVAPHPTPPCELGTITVRLRTW